MAKPNSTSSAPLEDVDQWSEALIVKSEVAAVLWPSDSPKAGSRQMYQNSNVFIQVGWSDCPSIAAI